jgi:F-type H+-transporting ATPase subunit c
MNRFLAFAFVMFTSLPAFADGHAAVAGDSKGWIAIAAALAISVAAFGGAIAQGRAATAALEGIARNPNASGKVFTPMILALALIESLVIYALLIAFQLIGKIV